jgi:hypothetical protein
MKLSTLILLLVIASFNSFSQSQTIMFFNDARPQEYDNGSFLQANDILKEMIYRYKKKDKNNDSVLVVINYFDSAGNCLEQDEFGESNDQPKENY